MIIDIGISNRCSKCRTDFGWGIISLRSLLGTRAHIDISFVQISTVGKGHSSAPTDAPIISRGGTWWCSSLRFNTSIISDRFSGESYRTTRSSTAPIYICTGNAAPIGGDGGSGLDGKGTISVRFEGDGTATCPSAGISSCATARATMQVGEGRIAISNAKGIVVCMVLAN